MILTITTFGKALNIDGGYMLPINVAAGGVCCTLNTRYDNPSLPNDILTLAHYPRTVILYEYE